jgi:hypothetical protein
MALGLGLKEDEKNLNSKIQKDRKVTMVKY